MKTRVKQRMLQFHPQSSNLKITFAAFLFLLCAMNFGCQKNQLSPGSSSSSVSDQPFIDLKQPGSNDLTQVNLVSDVADFSPKFIDDKLVNAWGLAFNDEGQAWISSNEKGLSTVYNGNGVSLQSPVGIPFEGNPTGGSPTGDLYNGTTTFVIPSTGEVSEFIFATENGTIAAWSSGSRALTVADESSTNAVYKGLAMAKSMSGWNLYATDFRNAKVDVFNDHFELLSGYSFSDPNLPAGYAPFNIRELDGSLYVTYAKQLAPENKDDDAGPGHGYVDVFDNNGTFIRRLASEGTLNSPWGIEKIPGSTPMILVGNFGDGKINVFDMNGDFLAYLKSGGNDVVIDGLWAITFPFSNVSPDERRRLYFTAGPNEESHSIFGYLTK